MKTAVLAALLFTSTLTIGTVAAQPAPYNEIGVTMGHWHIISKDVEANKKLFLGMGGKLFMPGGNPLMMFPGIYINLNLGTEKGDGGNALKNIIIWLRRSCFLATTFSLASIP